MLTGANVLLTHLSILSAVLAVIQSSGFVKVANFYNKSIYDERIVKLNLRPKDLVSLAVDTDSTLVRLPLRDAPFYGLSESWTLLNDTIYFGRVSLFTVNMINVETEHNILKFRDNITISDGDRSLMIVSRDQHYPDGLGVFCNMGKTDNKVATLHFCLNDIEIDVTKIKVVAQRSNCQDCPKYKLQSEFGLNSFKVSLPDPEPASWNVTVEHRRPGVVKHTTLCGFVSEISPLGLNMVIVRENLTVTTMYECVVFTENNTNNLDLWVPILCCFAGVVLLALASVVIYKKCDKACIRNLMPTPDQDSAPYRSIHSESPGETDSQYCKMEPTISDRTYDTYHRDVTSSNGTMTSHSVMTSHGGWKSMKHRDVEPQYERI